MNQKLLLSSLRFLFFTLLTIPTVTFANNLLVSNVQLASIDAPSNTAMIQFDVTWDNSWRDTINWDAAWIFIKYRPAGETGAWSHATLNYVDGTTDGHMAPVGSSINTPDDGKGVFIYRSDTAMGTVNFVSVQLQWNYGTDGLMAADLTDADLCVTGIEMVYVASGSFFVGDGDVSDLHGHFENGSSGNAFEVTSEGAITLGGGSLGSLGNNNRTGAANGGLFSIPSVSIDDFDDGATQTLPATFPKGFDAFYCMKYELTQGQFADFLNKLDSTQFANRYDANFYFSAGGGHTSTRYNITGTHPNMTTITPDIPVIYLEYYDGAAYGDWCALRPMTELEFEKACRGPLAPVPGEYAWGDTTISTSWYPTANVDAPNEGISGSYNTTGGNAWYKDTRSFPACVRVGAFAANALNSGRATSGASYWGMMELSGNCWERCISVGRPESRIFTGSHGDGNLMPNGNADNTDWPGFTVGVGIDNSIGAGYRGGAFEFPDPTRLNLRVASRILATAFYNVDPLFDDTMRYVRTAQ